MCFYIEFNRNGLLSFFFLLFFDISQPSVNILMYIILLNVFIVLLNSIDFNGSAQRPRFVLRELINRVFSIFQHCELYTRAPFHAFYDNNYCCTFKIFLVNTFCVK